MASSGQKALETPALEPEAIGAVVEEVTTLESKCPTSNVEDQEPPQAPPQTPQTSRPKVRGLSASTKAGALCAIIFLSALAFCSMTLGSHLFEYYEEQREELHRDELKRALGLSLTPGVRDGSLKAERLAAVRTSITPLFDVLPKNQAGKISAEVMRYVAHRYFSNKYGWHVRGFEPYKGNGTQLADAKILRSKVPEYCDAVLKGSLTSAGLSVEDAATLLAGIEQLIFDDIVGSLEQAYALNDYPVTGPLQKRKMLQAIYSLLIESMLEGNFTNKRQHTVDKAHIREIYPNWDTATLFIDDIVGAYSFEQSQSTSPFARGSKTTYTFEETAQLSTRVYEEFGPWVNYECKNMKDSLAKMDVHGTGRVKLADFYRASQNGQWHFHESVEYLKSLGALDDSVKSLGAQVIIPNYVLSVSNCIMSTPHFSVCCLNECEGVMRQLEAQLEAPTASIPQIVKAVEQVTATGTPPVVNGTTLLTRLEEVANYHGHIDNRGMVPIHGRMFSQWLHYVFPRECPYPHSDGEVNPMSPSEWVAAAGEDSISVKEKDLHEHLQLSHALEPPSPKAGASMWVVREELLPASTPSDEVTVWGSNFVRVISAMGIVTASLIVVVRLLGRISRAFSGKSATAKPVETVTEN